MVIAGTMVGACFYFLAEGDNFPLIGNVEGWKVAVCFVLGLLMIPATTGAGSKTTDMRSAQWCETLGNLSYPLYITHYPLMYVQMTWAATHQSSPAWHHVVLNIGMCVISIGIAWALLKLYDEPVRAWLKKKLFAK